MKLVQILLPLYAKTGRRLPRSLLRKTALSLAEQYGGVTAYTRAPARGLWLKRKKSKGKKKIDRDDVVIFEIMLSRANSAEWAKRRKVLEREFEQEQIIIRALPFTHL